MKLILKNKLGFENRLFMMKKIFFNIFQTVKILFLVIFLFT